MLSSITPLGERSRGQRWGVTVAAHAAAAALVGAVLGGLLAAAGSVLPLGTDGRLALLACLLAVAVVADARVGVFRVPTITRQVDDRWLRRYRGFVYGAGFGAQLGAGVATIVTTAAVYVVVAGSLLAPSPVWGCAIGAVFGFARGAAPMTTAAVHDPAALAAFHRGFVRHGPLAARATVTTLAVLAAVALAGLAL